MPLSRRLFLSGAATTLAFSGFAPRSGAQGAPSTYRNEVFGYGELVRDPEGIFDLPEGFSYEVVSRAGERMSDGFVVPYKADGMGCFQFEPDRVVLVRNHELHQTRDTNFGPLDIKQRLAPGSKPFPAYDVGDDGLPLPGGTTTLVYDLKARRLVSQNLSLAGTTTNCAGGNTPWGSWLSCEERLVSAGDQVGKSHGWVFEVPAVPGRVADGVPLTGLGRFMHEAAAVDPATGVVYLTEDRTDTGSLFYRFLPNVRGELHRGGRLQALGLRDAPAGGDTRNHAAVTWKPGDWKEAVWVDLDGVDNPDADLHLRGHAAGAAWFARGEGIHFGERELYFTCTSGGAAKLGQIMRYVPSPSEGQPGERDQPGRIQLFLESQDRKRLDYADNIAVAPWGHLFTCEDQYSERPVNHLKGITPDGKVYVVGRNAFRDASELAGVCFSPDGSTLFLNIYWPGITLAVTGPWERFRA